MGNGLVEHKGDTHILAYPVPWKLLQMNNRKINVAADENERLHLR